MNEARRRGIQPRVALEDFASTQVEQSGQAWTSDLRSVVRSSLSQAKDAPDRYNRALSLVCESRAARGGHLYSLEGQAPKLVATHALPEPTERLADYVREYLDEQEGRFDPQTIAAHGAPELTMAPLTRVEGADYELLLLSRVSEHGAEITGVVALAPGPEDKANPLQALLLASIAEELGSGWLARGIESQRAVLRREATPVRRLSHVTQCRPSNGRLSGRISFEYDVPLPGTGRRHLHGASHEWRVVPAKASTSPAPST